jgi:hypothetical protein
VEEKTTSTAVICAGDTGKTLAGLLCKAEQPVVIAASRVPTGIAHPLGGSVTAATVVDAIDHSEADVRSGNGGGIVRMRQPQRIRTLESHRSVPPSPLLTRQHRTDMKKQLGVHRWYSRGRPRLPHKYSDAQT